MLTMQVLDELSRSVRDDAHLTAIDLNDKVDRCVDSLVLC